MRKLFTVRIGMPFFSSCIRAITSSICATQEQRERKRKRKRQREYFSHELVSVGGEQMDKQRRRLQPTLLEARSFAAQTCSGLQKRQKTDDQNAALSDKRHTNVDTLDWDTTGSRLRGPAEDTWQPRFPEHTWKNQSVNA